MGSMVTDDYQGLPKGSVRPVAGRSSGLARRGLSCLIQIAEPSSFEV
jgi:hypothetical protein